MDQLGQSQKLQGLRRKTVTRESLLINKIAGEVVTLPTSFPSFASVRRLPFLKGVAHATAFGA